MRRYARRLLVVAGLVALLALGAAATASGFGESAVPRGHGIADDCSGGASLAPGSKTTVDWVVWCGPAKGRVRIKIEPPKQASPARSYSGARMIGGTPGDGLDCRFGRATSCRLEKNGPITVRGSFNVAHGACAGRTLVQIPSTRSDQGEAFYDDAWGCPGSKPPSPPKISKILKFRAGEILDPGLSMAARKANARRLRQAWIDEEPVERWSQRAWGSPLDATDAELLALRLESGSHAADLIGGWVERHRMQATFAGWTIATDGTIYIGFTAEQEAIVTRMKSELPFVEPAWVKPFPVAPVHTLSELEALEGLIIKYLEDRGSFATFTSMSTDFLANKVEVSATNPTKARKVLTAKFGPEAPIEVVKGYPAVFV